jgi:hypothetical protein
MLISKIHLPRRTVLKALGATVGLPLLDAMIPAGTALARTTAGAVRPCMSFIYFPHGAVMEQWTPVNEGVGLDLAPILAPLAPYRKQLTVVSGLENKSANAPPVHALTPATWLGCTAPKVGAQACAGVTVDQVAAARLGGDTRLDSIQVATEAHGGEGSTDPTYGDVYARTISFRDASTPLAMEHDPRKVFALLFPEDDARGGGAQPAARRVAAGLASDAGADCAVFTRRGSVLDLVRDDTAALSRKLGPRDRAVLDDYLANVRSIERRVQAFVPPTPAPTPEHAGEIPTAFDERMRLMFDLIALAYEANVTRVASFMMAAEVSDQSYDFIGISESFHALSHHGNSPAKLERLAKVQAYNTGLFAKFVSKLAATRDGDGSLLDHSLIVYGSNMSNSNLHDHSGLPVALLGGACGNLVGDRHVRCPEYTPLANLHVALLNKVGVPTATFGDSTGSLEAV